LGDINEAQEDEPSTLIQATMLHNFEGQADEELTVKKGDIVMVNVEQVD